MGTRGQGHCLTFDSMSVSNTSSKALEPIEIKFHMEPPWAEGRKNCSNSPDHMVNRASMPIYGKNL